MRVLVVFAHPSPESFDAALCSAAVAGLKEGGHEVDLLDLYREGLTCGLTLEEWNSHPDGLEGIDALAPHIARLRAAQALVFVFPVWHLHPPAATQAYLERVWGPGVAYREPGQPGARIEPLLTNVQKVMVVTSHALPTWIMTLALGNPPRRYLWRMCRDLMGSHVKKSWLALGNVYGSSARRDAFLERVRSAAARF
ncbi:MAG TPA: NAD(P)H-dependent oxidoreductase [Afifellaceae bacterium]|nr:NAD(P)H-dependent oxidoreductase [Afifellaceae bacterium]